MKGICVPLCLLAVVGATSPTFAGSESPPVIMSRWSFVCPDDVRGKDGFPLCSARYWGFPALNVERTDAGMKMSVPAKCGEAVNRFGSEVDAYTKINVVAELKPDASAKHISDLIAFNLAKVPKIITKNCPGNSVDVNEYKIDYDQIISMVEVVFIKKKLPF